MKIVFCGPPHSGKSVFIANLIDQLPTDAYTIIRACPDGEGTWSNNKNQNETSMVRKKGKFTKSFIEDSCQAIDNQTNKIVLVDVGGVMSKENEQVFKHCDSFVVLSSDKEKKKEWLEFGENLGLSCVGYLDSSLEGQEEIYSREPYFQGKIVGLERGELLEDSTVIKALVSDIIQKSKYAEKTTTNDQIFEDTMIDDTKLGFELGYGKEIFTEDGIAIRKVRWQEKAIPQIYQEIQGKVKGVQSVKINGIRANFILSAICKECRMEGVKDIQTYDIRMKQYIPIKKLPKKRGLKESEGLAYHLIENKENIFMDIELTKEQYSLADYQNCVLPQIREDKNLYLSGRMPLWLLASISSSYDSNKIFTFQPGKGFTCVSSLDEKDLGEVLDGIDGINMNQYFEDKKETRKNKLPEVVKKQGLLSKVKNLFANRKERKEKSKYLDATIKANRVETSDVENSIRNEFQVELQSNRTDKSDFLHQQTKQDVPIEKDIGG